MRTQKHDLKDEIKRLEKDLQYAVLNEIRNKTYTMGVKTYLH